MATELLCVGDRDVSDELVFFGSGMGQRRRRWLPFWPPNPPSLPPLPPPGCGDGDMDVRDMNELIGRCGDGGLWLALGPGHGPLELIQSPTGPCRHLRHSCPPVASPGDGHLGS